MLGCKDGPTKRDLLESVLKSIGLSARLVSGFLEDVNIGLWFWSAIGTFRSIHSWWLSSWRPVSFFHLAKEWLVDCTTSADSFLNLIVKSASRDLAADAILNWRMFSMSRRCVKVALMMRSPSFDEELENPRSSETNPLRSEDDVEDKPLECKTTEW